MERCYLVLADGSCYPGFSFGAVPPLVEELSLSQTAPSGMGEVVFVTGMSGYHETLTDPSYTGQIVALTYPHAGNYGCEAAWTEHGPEPGRAKRTVKPSGVVVRELYRGPVPGGRVPLTEFLHENGVPGITGVDTRRLTLDLRDKGARNGAIVRLGESAEWIEGRTGDPVPGRSSQQFAGPGAPPDATRLEPVLAVLREFPPMEERRLVAEVGAREVVRLNEGAGPRIALLDCGVKAGIIRELTARGCEVVLLPSDASLEAVRAVEADALFISNGPGDPAGLTGQIEVIRAALGEMPVLGICLGHQLIAHALGARTFKMKFGHHGLNHPVRDERTGRVFVTSQNHGFAVDEHSLPAGCAVWLRNANDGTVEGILHEELPVGSVQFHPEASPGPLDAGHLFDCLLELLGRRGQ